MKLQHDRLFTLGFTFLNAVLYALTNHPSFGLSAVFFIGYWLSQATEHPLVEAQHELLDLQRQLVKQLGQENVKQRLTIRKLQDELL